MSIDLEAINAAHQAATREEWTVEIEEYGNSGSVTVNGLNRLLHDTEWADPQDFEQDQANAESVAALHNAWPAVYAEMLALKASLAAARERLATAEADSRRLREAIGHACPEEPMVQDEQGGCVWCGGHPPGRPLNAPRKQDHDATCGWVLGRAAIDAAGGQADAL